MLKFLPIGAQLEGRHHIKIFGATIVVIVCLACIHVIPAVVALVVAIQLNAELLLVVAISKPTVKVIGIPLQGHPVDSIVAALLARSSALRIKLLGFLEALVHRLVEIPRHVSHQIEVGSLSVAHTCQLADLWNEVGDPANHDFYQFLPNLLHVDKKYIDLHC